MEDRLQLLVEAVVDYGIFLLDTEGHVVSWNSGAQKLKGWRKDEILGKHFSIFYPPEAVATGWPDEELRRAARDGRFEDEGWRVRKDGTRFWANVVITALREPGGGGALTGFAKVTRDLTERRAHEEALRTSEERFRLLVDSVRDHAIFMLDRDGKVQSWNPAAEAIHDQPAEQAIGLQFRMLFSPPEREAGRPEAILEQARIHGRTEDEGWRQREDGTRFWAKSVVTAVYGRSGEPLGFAVVTQDLSQQRRMEDLERSSRRLNDFIALLAHELRNPLAPIRNGVTLMQMDKTLSPPLVKVRDIIDRQLAQLTRLVDDLLDVSRLTTGKITLRPERVDIAEIVRHSVETVRPLIDARRHELHVDVPAHAGLLVEGDPTRLAQVLQNLLVNAAKYTPDGGRISLSARRAGNDAEVIVHDNGRGIAAQDLDRIFELFAQGETAPGAFPDSGLGVGLALARQLVRLHGGRMMARSAGVGQGAEFSFRIPLAKGL
ncbi:PAS domain-containing sensor histidine kinase [Ramlibacter sp. MMS24-I3-19]|uniref:sensor histidine kinase n=1 Tax=Ramlibacter sp. MMS24-I3-19 TaxID=3416606 RepID=UPI003D05B8C1